MEGKIYQTPKTIAVIVGVLILVAYSMLFGEISHIKWLTSLFDAISGLAVIGIAVLMFPYFNTFSRRLSYGYLFLKILEGLLMIVAGMFFLSSMFAHWRAYIYDYPQTYVFIISAFLFYFLLLKTRLVPPFISIWGLIACGALSLVNLTKLLNVSYPALDVLLILIVTNEVFLAIWLMTKGFNTSTA